MNAEPAPNFPYFPLSPYTLVVWSHGPYPISLVLTLSLSCPVHALPAPDPSPPEAALLLLPILMSLAPQVSVALSDPLVLPCCMADWAL